MWKQRAGPSARVCLRLEAQERRAQAVGLVWHLDQPPAVECASLPKVPAALWVAVTSLLFCFINFHLESLSDVSSYEYK